VVAQPDERRAEQLLCWSGMTDTEHSTTSSSNEEVGYTEVNVLDLVYTWRTPTGVKLNSN